MSTAIQSMTAEELLRLPDDNMRHELVKGELRTMAPSGGEHGITTIRVTLPVARYVEEKGLGVVFGAETGFILSRNPDTVRAPDLAFIATEKLPATGIPRRGYWPGAPDLAVEVLSPDDSACEVEEKVADYFEAGTRMVWVVNPRRRTVTVYRSPQTSTILSATDELDGQEVVPGFRCRIADIFISA